MFKLVVINNEIGELIEPDCVQLLDSNQRVYFQDPDDIKEVVSYNEITGEFEYVEDVEIYSFSSLDNGDFSMIDIEETDDGIYLIQDEDEVFLSQAAIDRFVDMMGEE